MAISIGSKIPSATIKCVKDGDVTEIDTAAYLAGKKVILFSVPGAYTPTCSNTHLPGYVAEADALAAKGLDEIVCLAVNDVHVMKAWAADKGAVGKVTMFADGSDVFTKALGLELDLTGAGLGVRGQRFSMMIEDGTVKSLDVEPGSGVTVSGAEACLAKL